MIKAISKAIYENWNPTQLRNNHFYLPCVWIMQQTVSYIYILTISKTTINVKAFINIYTYENKQGPT